MVGVFGLLLAYLDLLLDALLYRAIGVVKTLKN